MHIMSQGIRKVSCKGSIWRPGIKLCGVKYTKKSTGNGCAQRCSFLLLLITSILATWIMQHARSAEVKSLAYSCSVEMSRKSKKLTLAINLNHNRVVHTQFLMKLNICICCNAWFRDFAPTVSQICLGKKITPFEKPCSKLECREKVWYTKNREVWHARTAALTKNIVQLPRNERMKIF